ncbi:uncharacterized protein LOC122067291 [Macadamia integrifolia]|uniref:uncharacterized protein LOC122067291 n=1 Tax=Macadamia integrifolia TaxID=60698 RepID=UPI001C4F0AC3|nr:uncharacterized protein LOC122067291 [Macadamia integrifolia]
MDTEGILCEVLSRLPAKSLLRSQAVSKTCSSFSSDNFFIRKHSEQALTMDVPGFFIQQHHRWGKIELHMLPGSKEKKKNFDDYGVPNTSLDFIYNTSKILGSHNGLLVLKNMNEDRMGLFLCNPATKKCFTIPNPTPNSTNHFLWGIHIVSNSTASATKGFPDNLEVIMIKPIEEWAPYNSIYKYTINGQSWEEMGEFYTGDRSIVYDMPVYCKGAIHFISDTFRYLSKGSPDYKPYIVACDIDKGISWRLKLPKEASRRSHDITCEMGIFNWGKSLQSSLCLIRLRKSVFMAWVLDDYEMSSWTLVLKTRVRAMGLEEPNPVVYGFTVINGDSLVFATVERIYRCRLILSGGRPRQSVEAEEICRHDLGRNTRHLWLTGYANTLRPCGTAEHPLPSYLK